MKILNLFIILFLFTSQIGVAQLTLQKVNGSRTKVIPLGSELTIKFPTKTARKDCDCFQSYTGILKYATKDSVTMELSSERRYFAQDTDFFKTIYTMKKLFTISLFFFVSFFAKAQIGNVGFEGGNFSQWQSSISAKLWIFTPAVSISLFRIMKTRSRSRNP